MINAFIASGSFVKLVYTCEAADVGMSLFLCWNHARFANTTFSSYQARGETQFINIVLGARRRVDN